MVIAAWMSPLTSLSRASKKAACLSVYVFSVVVIQLHQIDEYKANRAGQNDLEQPFSEVFGLATFEKIFRDWITAVGSQTAYIELGSPWESGCCESFNGSLRDELLNQEYSSACAKIRT